MDNARSGFEPGDPGPRPDPAVERVDYHQGPLDNDEDGRWLPRSDPRARRGRAAPGSTL